MTKTSIYGFITIMAMITMPAAASINFGYAAYTALLDRVDTAVPLAIVGGITTGIGFESIGILAGHLSVSYHGRQDGRYKAAAAALVAYIIIGTWELWGVKFAQFVPLLAGLVYLLAGLQYEAVEEMAERTAVSGTRLKFDLEQARLDRETERRIKLEKQQAANAAKLARIEKTATYQRHDTRQDAGILPTDWRQLTDRQRFDFAHATREQREDMMPDLAPRTRRAWHERGDEIAAQNGHYLQEK